MSERSELLEATFDGRPEGIALLGQQCYAVLWNRSAEAITGFLGLDLVGRPAPDSLEALLLWCGDSTEPEPVSSPLPERGCQFTSASPPISCTLICVRESGCFEEFTT